MIQRITLIIALCVVYCSASAVDRIVQEFGGAGTFGSITSAVNAASDGDRIVVINRAGGLVWQENVSINKSLTFVPGVDGTRFKVQGDYIVAPSVTPKAIRIVGMENVAGSISSSNDGPSGTRTSVEIVGCDLLGNIVFNHNNYDVTLASNVIAGDISLRFGGLYGNDFGEYNLSVGTDAVPSNDVVEIIGNRMDVIFWGSSAHFFFIANNFVAYKETGISRAISISSVKNSSLTTNVIQNNSVRVQVNTCCSGTPYGIYIIAGGAQARIDVLNNAIERVTTNTSTYGLFVGSTANVFAGYNHIDNSFGSRAISGITNNGTNVVSFPVNVAPADGSVTGTAVVNGGSPEKAYTDHDLTVNDPGCFGGSFNANNYFPITNGPRVFHVRAPRAIFQGGTLDIESDGFDR